VRSMERVYYALRVGARPYPPSADPVSRPPLSPDGGVSFGDASAPSRCDGLLDGVDKRIMLFAPASEPGAAAPYGSALVVDGSIGFGV
jgi:hypothetical protein